MALMEIAIGCRFEFEVAVPTHAVMLVEPHPDEARRVHREALGSTPALVSGTYLDLFDNRCRRMTLPPGPVEVVYEGIVVDDGRADDIDPAAPELAPAELPDDVLVYLLPSRYCQSDELADFAFAQFGAVRPGWSRVQAISEWVHGHIGFDYGKASPSFTAADVLASGHGVCRDFTHLGVALCRALNIPTRYVFGYLPDIGVPDPGVPMDFCAWMEAYLGGRWFTFDPRNHAHRIGRTVIGRGRDAADVAMVTTFGHVDLRSMTVVAEEVTASPA
jgi:transglutaminase-like putative cysteine protease